MLCHLGGAEHRYYCGVMWPPTMLYVLRKTRSRVTKDKEKEKLKHKVWKTGVASVSPPIYAVWFLTCHYSNQITVTLGEAINSLSVYLIPADSHDQLQERKQTTPLEMRHGFCISSPNLDFFSISLARSKNRKCLVISGLFISISRVFSPTFIQGHKITSFKPMLTYWPARIVVGRRKFSPSSSGHRPYKYIYTYIKSYTTMSRVHSVSI